MPSSVYFFLEHFFLDVMACRHVFNKKYRNVMWVSKQKHFKSIFFV